MNLPPVKIVGNEDKYMIFEGTDLISLEVRRNGHYCRDFAKLAIDVLKGTDKDVLDIGANIGTFTIPVAKGIRGHVHAFEVQRVVFMQLCGNCVLNQLTNVTCHHKCVKSPLNTQTVIDIPCVDYALSSNNGCFSVDASIREQLAQYDVSARTTKEVEKVEAICIDDMSLENIGFVKMDVEGAELDVLRGMESTLKKNGYPPILFESWATHHWWQSKHVELVEAINGLGYHVYALNDFPDNFLAISSSP